MAVKTRLINPYIAGRALRDIQGFCGRDDILRMVEARLSSEDQGAVVLYGQRRIGKTSILLQLRRRLPAAPFMPVYFDLMDRARQPLGQVLGEIASALADEADMSLPDVVDFDDDGRFFIERFLPSLYEALGEERFPVLLLDEFDVLDTAATEQIAKTAAAHAFFPYLRRLMENEPRLKFIFVVGRRVEDLSIIVKSLFKTALTQRVSVLDPVSAHSLIRMAQRQGTLGFSRVVVEHILALTGGHPHLTQLLCQILWNDAHTTTSVDLPSIQRVEQVEAAADKTVAAGENIFEWIWDGLPPAERVIFAAIAAATNEQSVVTEDKLEELLQSGGIRILSNQLVLAPRTLVEWEMLREVDGGYSFCVELMRRWVVTRKPLSKVKDELDRIEPQADLLYRAADAFYHQRDLESAQNQLRTALRVNPTHLKARLLLGQVLFEHDQLDEAVTELEEAYRRDDDQSRHLLIRVLTACGEAHERIDAADRALAAYERVLAISQHETVARERRIALLYQRAEQLVREGRLEQARQTYELVGDTEKAAHVTQQQAQQAQEQAIAKAEAYEQRDEWNQALAIYQQLMMDTPIDSRWHEAVARIKTERDLFARYIQGRDALARQEHALAIGMLSQLVQYRPSYRDAAQLLAAAQQLVTAELRKREEAGDWVGAQAICRDIAKQHPKELFWGQEIARLVEEQSLAEHYAAGTVALGRRDWATAKAELEAVVQLRPGYKDAARLLQRAERGNRRFGYAATPGRWWAIIVGVSGLAALAVGVALGLLLEATMNTSLATSESPIVIGITMFAVFQWLVLRKKLVGAGWWIPATASGLMLGAVTSMYPSLAWLLGLGLFVSPISQWIVLQRKVTREWLWLASQLLAVLLVGIIYSLFAPSSTTQPTGSYTFVMLINWFVLPVALLAVQVWILRPVVSSLQWIGMTILGGFIGLGASALVYSIPMTPVIDIAIVLTVISWMIAVPLIARLFRRLYA
jgi:tetratricopeptide (TPR) repeat protein